jgi:chorismate mutase
MAVRAVRGAIQLDRDSSDEMSSGVARLVGGLLEANAIEEDDIVSIIFSQTKDLASENPARALRRSGFSGVPLFCTSEPEYPGSLPRVLRVLLTFETSSTQPPQPLYLDGARNLRPDLTGAGD